MLPPLLNDGRGYYDLEPHTSTDPAHHYRCLDPAGNVVEGLTFSHGWHVAGEPRVFKHWTDLTTYWRGMRLETAKLHQTKIDGFVAVLYPGQCHVSYGRKWARLDELKRDGLLRDAQMETQGVPQSIINLIADWAKAHGYIRERKRVQPTTPQESFNFDRQDPEPVAVAPRTRRVVIRGDEPGGIQPPHGERSDRRRVGSC